MVTSTCLKFVDFFLIFHAWWCIVLWVLNNKWSPVPPPQAWWKTVTAQQKLPHAPHLLSTPTPELEFPATTDLFSIHKVLPFPERHDRITQHGIFGVWLLSLSKVEIHPCSLSHSSFFSLLGIVHGTNVPQSVYPLTTKWRISQLFPVWGKYEGRYYKHVHTDFCVNLRFHFSWINT